MGRLKNKLTNRKKKKPKLLSQILLKKFGEMVLFPQAGGAWKSLKKRGSGQRSFLKLLRGIYGLKFFFFTDCFCSADF